MNKPAIAIIQARMSSSRLPGKVLKPLAGKPLIWHIYNRASRCNFVDKVIVATSDHKSDDELVNFCKQNKMNVFRGNLQNVLSRYTAILSKEQYRYYVRITGDCPLIHPQYIDNQVAALIKYEADHTWHEKGTSVLEGQGAHSTRSLFYISENSNNPDDFEHVGSVYLADNPHKFKIIEIILPEELIVNDLRLTVDELDDYKMISKLYEALWPLGRWIELRDAIEWLKMNPEISLMNKMVNHKTINVNIQKKRIKWKRKLKEFKWEYDVRL